MDCESGSRCATCHHSTARGCALLLALEGALDRPREGASGPGLARLNLWTSARADAAEA